MQQYIVKRLWQSILIFLGISLISFALLHLVGGGIEARFASDPRINAETLHQIETYYGLDKPWIVQYGQWFWSLLHGDLGRSIETLLPVTDEILEAIPNTLLLLGMGTILGLLGVPLGVFIALRRGGFTDNLVRVLTAIGSSIPHWWLGLIVLLVTSNVSNQYHITIIPLPGYNPNNTSFFYTLWQLILPSLLIAMSGWLYYSRLTRSQVLEVLNQDYVRTARSKGLTEKEINRTHVLRNAFLPIITAFADILPSLFSGSVIFENIFAIPGIGRLAFQALNSSDYPLAMGILMFSTVLVMLGILFSDVLYLIADPQIRYN